jgi:3'-phosphoadenosine 5'-phosphosulfate synthase
MLAVGAACLGLYYFLGAPAPPDTPSAVEPVPHVLDRPCPPPPPPVTCPPAAPEAECKSLGALRAERLSEAPPNILECPPGKVCRPAEEREKRYDAIGQRGVTMWFTGLSGSGKSTIAEAFEQKVVMEMGKHVYRLDGDNLRKGLNKDLRFGNEDRMESMRRASEVALMFAEAGSVAMVTLISPLREDRNKARELHKARGMPFLEVFLDVPLAVVQARDPKGLYKKVAEGKIKGFTGVDAPYEAPTNAEIRIENDGKSVEECVNILIQELRTRGLLPSSSTDAAGAVVNVGAAPAAKETAVAPADSKASAATPAPTPTVDLLVPDADRAAKRAEAETLAAVLLRDVDVHWLQVLGEGWAAPLRGFMREGVLLQALHFNSVLSSDSGSNLNLKTDFAAISRGEGFRESMPLPIVLPITSYTKSRIEQAASQAAVTLVDKHGRPLAIVRSPEIYPHRKEEIIARTFGHADYDHPYVKENILPSGDWLLGGEVELLEPIRYNDGFDQYRLTVPQLQAKFAELGADVVLAFQTRNPTHAGHAFLMNDGRRQLLEKGYKKPVLWLSPLGGWTKKGDMPLDVRIRQHEAVLAEGMLDKATTVMAIWPAPMMYAGPTEVQFHARSRQLGGADYFVVGRDPAGMPYQSSANAGTAVSLHDKGDDIYAAEHGRFVLQQAPGLENMHMLAFPKVYYDKQDHQMRVKDKTRPGDFISISGTKMRKLAKQGASPCVDPIPLDIVAANCIPQGFMVPSGWAVMVEYYQQLSGTAPPKAESSPWIPFAQPMLQAPPALAVAPYTVQSAGAYGTVTWNATFTTLADHITELYLPTSPWHQVPLQPAEGTAEAEGASAQQLFNFIVEIPQGSTAKLEVQKELRDNPIAHDTKKGVPRYYTYGVPFFNYGLLPQTWEDPALNMTSSHGGADAKGDNDPLDVMELSGVAYPIGSVVPCVLLGVLELIDQGELDYKILVMAADHRTPFLGVVSLAP